MRSSFPLVLGLAAIAAAHPCSATAQGPAWSELVVFGDSLSDDGNLFALTGQPGSPYWNGRFSNGRVWVERLADELGLGGVTNLAIGGATTSDVVRHQVVPYVTANPTVSSDALFVIWAGANDLLDLLQNPGDPTAAIQNAMQQIGTAATALVMRGARHVLVPNLPDLGATPRALAAGPAAAAQATLLAAAYNAALARTLAFLEGALRIDLLEYDVFAVMGAIAAEPAAFGLWDVATPSLATIRPWPMGADTFLFFDDIHPTRVGHHVLADLAAESLGIRRRGDFDGDRALDWRDVTELAARFGPCAAAEPADLNGDLEVDWIDLRALVLTIRP